MIVNGESDGNPKIDGGYVTRNLTIRANLFEDCFLQGAQFVGDCKGGNTISTAGCAAVISSAVVGMNTTNQGVLFGRVQLLNWRGHSNLLIARNVIKGWQRDVMAIQIAGAVNVTIRDNVMDAMASGSFRQGGWGAAVEIANSTRCRISNNTVCGPFRDASDAFVKGLDAVDVSVSGNNVVATNCKL